MPANDLPQAKFPLTNIVAVMGVLALHGLATWGLANAASPKFPDPKTDELKPIEIQLVTPIEEKPPEVVEIKAVEPPPTNNVSGLEPKQKPEPKPEIHPKPEPKPKPVVEPKPQLKPEPKPVVAPKPKTDPKPMPQVVQDTSTAIDNSFALEQQRQADLDKQRQADLDKQRQADLDKQRQADLDKQRQADLNKQRQADLDKQRQADLDKQRQADLDKQRQAASNTPVSFSEGQATWRQPPNLRALARLNHGANPGDVLRVVVTIIVDKQGNVSAVTKNSSSGNTAIDNAVVRAIKASKLNPFSQNGAPVIGTLTIPVNYEVPKR